jgi:hypothetical protein
MSKKRNEAEQEIISVEAENEGAGKATGSRRSPDAPEGWVSLNEATAIAGFSASQYMRRLAITGKVRAVKLAEGGITKWYIDPDSVTDYKATPKSFNRKGLRRYVLKIDAANEDAVRDALDDMGVEYLLDKPKSYHKQAATEGRRRLRR